MTNRAQIPEWLQKHLLGDAQKGIPEVIDRDLACLILQDLDYEAQIIAIEDILRHHKEIDTRTTTQIKELENFARKAIGLRNEQAVDEWVDLLNRSIYQDAAHSMVALGMLAPLIESLLFQAFQGIRLHYYGALVIPPGTARAGMRKPDDFWDCHFIFNAKVKSKKEKDFVSGVAELAKAIHLTPHLPAQLPTTLKALFQHRNKMFHSGFEWPAKECASFAKIIAAEGWDAWFSSAKRNHVPFIFYMTDTLIEHLFHLLHKILEGFGAYCRGKVPIPGNPSGI